MPRVTGVDIFQWLKNNRPDQPILFITGNQGFDSLNGIDQDDMMILEKPFSYIELKKAI